MFVLKENQSETVEKEEVALRNVAKQNMWENLHIVSLLMIRMSIEESKVILNCIATILLKNMIVKIRTDICNLRFQSFSVHQVRN